MRTKSKRVSCIGLVLLVILLAILMTGCGNRQLVDTTYTFNRAIVSLPDGSVIEGEVDSWKDFEDGDQIQVKIDGTTYLVHASNVVLIKDSNN